MSDKHRKGWTNDEIIRLTEMVADKKTMEDLEAAFVGRHSEEQIIWKLRNLHLTLAGEVPDKRFRAGMRRCLGPDADHWFWSPDKTYNAICPNCSRNQGRIVEYSVTMR